MSDTDRRELFVQAQAERRAALVVRAADRPAHADYLAAMLDRDDPADAPLPERGVSERYADALLDDVWWIKQEPPAEGNAAAYPNAYSTLRHADAVAGRARARTRARGSVASLLPGKEVAR